MALATKRRGHLGRLFLLVGFFPLTARPWAPPRPLVRTPSVLGMGRWDPPPPEPVAGVSSKRAREAFANEARAASTGAIIADARSKVVELPRGGTGVEWGTDLSFVGVYVREVEENGAAMRSGLVAKGDQLVAINGTAALDLSFDDAMAFLAREGKTVRLELFEGSRDELLRASGREVGQQTDTATIRVFDNGFNVQDVRVTKGANLRDALVEAGVDVYKGSTKWTNCRGKQLCGTCIVDVKSGSLNTNRKSNDEMGTLNLQNTADSCRLSCVTFVYGDVDVHLKPDRQGFFGAATSGSAW